MNLFGKNFFVPLKRPKLIFGILAVLFLVGVIGSLIPSEMKKKYKEGEDLTSFLNERFVTFIRDSVRTSDIVSYALEKVEHINDYATYVDDDYPILVGRYQMLNDVVSFVAMDRHQKRMALSLQGKMRGTSRNGSLQEALGEERSEWMKVLSTDRTGTAAEALRREFLSVAEQLDSMETVPGWKAVFRCIPAEGEPLKLVFVVAEDRSAFDLIGFGEEKTRGR